MKPVVPRIRPLTDAGGASSTDIIMNLFVFFFIAFSLLATFDKREAAQDERAHEIALPRGGGEAGAPRTGAVIVEIGKADALRVDGRPVLAAQLTAELARALGPERKAVVVRADRALSLGATVAHLDRIWAAGPDDVSIATLAGDGAARADRQAAH